MLRNEDSIVESLTKELDLSKEEASIYVNSLKEKIVKESVRGRESPAIKSLHARGMLILASNGKDYLPVHPRLALSNLFRAYEEKLVRQRKEKRLTVDKLTILLLPIYEESKGTNSTSKEGT
jgi:hypothetical protein